MEFQIKGYTVQVDTEDADLFCAYKWHAVKASYAFYVIRDLRIGSKRTTQYLHRVILARMLGREPESNEHTDHINGDGLDNRRSNLRVASISENMRNQRKQSNNTSGYKGASFDKNRNKWRAQIYVDGKRKNLGSYATREEARDAYREAAERLFGEFARYE